MVSKYLKENTYELTQTIIHALPKIFGKVWPQPKCRLRSTPQCICKLKRVYFILTNQFSKPEVFHLSIMIISNQFNTLIRRQSTKRHFKRMHNHPIRCPPIVCQVCQVCQWQGLDDENNGKQVFQRWGGHLYIRVLVAKPLFVMAETGEHNSVLPS